MENVDKARYALDAIVDPILHRGKASAMGRDIARSERRGLRFPFALTVPFA